MSQWRGKIHGWYICAFAWSLIACANTETHLDGMDLQAWKEDPHGCKELRAAMIPALGEQRDKLLRLSEMEIINLLGKPDENELYVRSQQFYRYYLEPAPECDPGKESPKVLVIRFNALGVSNEVSVE